MLRRVLKLTLAGYLLLLLYAGWMPLDFHLDRTAALAELRAAVKCWPAGPAGDLMPRDVRINVVAFGTLGGLLGGAALRAWSRWRSVLAGAAVGGAMSLLIEMGQLVLPWRTASLADVVIGAAAGGGADAMVGLLAAVWPGLPRARRRRFAELLRDGRLDGALGVLLCVLGATAFAWWAGVLERPRSDQPLWTLYWSRDPAGVLSAAPRWGAAASMGFLLVLYASLRTSWRARYRLTAGAVAAGILVTIVAAAGAVASGRPAGLAWLAEHLAAAACGALLMAGGWQLLDRRRRRSTPYDGPRRRCSDAMAVGSTGGS